MGKISKFFRLNGSEKLLFCRAVYLLIHSRVALHRQPFQTLVDGHSTSNFSDHLQASEPIPVDNLIRLLAAACRFIPLTTCLSRAMAGQRLLTTCGHSPILHIGVARERNRNLEAHAWLSLDGKIILGNIPDLERYRELPPLPARELKGA